MEQDRRRTPRYPFVAQAEVSESAMATPIKGQVSELSLNGCFMTSPTQLAKGTLADIKINTPTEFFEAHGSVIYSEPNEGMGIMFLDTKPFYLSVLKKWVLSAMLRKGRPQS